jgi:hypothetical protein
MKEGHSSAAKPYSALQTHIFKCSSILPANRRRGIKIAEDKIAQKEKYKSS